MDEAKRPADHCEEPPLDLPSAPAEEASQGKRSKLSRGGTPAASDEFSLNTPDDIVWTRALLHPIHRRLTLSFFSFNLSRRLRKSPSGRASRSTRHNAAA